MIESAETINILGLDPGSRHLGFGVLTLNRLTNQYSYLASGCLHLKDSGLGIKLTKIYEAIKELAIKYRPSEVAVETVFVKLNPASAIKLGQARGAAIAAAVSQGASLAEYSPRAVKQALVGYGSAEKIQVQQMVKLLLKQPKLSQLDETDALAIAICHAHSRTKMALTNRL